MSLLSPVLRFYLPTITAGVRSRPLEFTRSRFVLVSKPITSKRVTISTGIVAWKSDLPCSSDVRCLTGPLFSMKMLSAQTRPTLLRTPSCIFPV